MKGIIVNPSKYASGAQTLGSITRAQGKPALRKAVTVPYTDKEVKELVRLIKRNTPLKEVMERFPHRSESSLKHKMAHLRKTNRSSYEEWLYNTFFSGLED